MERSKTIFKQRTEQAADCRQTDGTHHHRRNAYFITVTSRAPTDANSSEGELDRFASDPSNRRVYCISFDLHLTRRICKTRRICTHHIA
jgi:hypothetical protein